jgi:hypothetical protein
MELKRTKISDALTPVNTKIDLQVSPDTLSTTDNAVHNKLSPSQVGVAPEDVEVLVPTLLDGPGTEPLLTRIGCIRYESLKNPVLRICMRNKLGIPLDLTGRCDVVVGSFSEYVLGRVRNDVICFDGEFAGDGSDGLVDIPIDTKKIGGAGIYSCEAIAATISNGVVATQRFMLYVEKSLADSWSNYGPPLKDDLSLSIRASTPAENRLLNRMMWDDAEIAQAICTTIQLWNNEHPIDFMTFDSRSFPLEFRPMFYKGIVANLFELAIEDIRKNDITLQAGGFSGNEEKRMVGYMQEAQRRIAEFTKWASDTKTNLCARRAWATFHSPHIYL